MGRLSNISDQPAVKILENFGYELDHQTESQMILWHDTKPISVLAQNHES
jgi:hypothetical protein